jgi:tetratricopeptide (TPR) repeat protein
MNEKKQETTTLLAYIYKNINPYFWANVLKAKDLFPEIFVFNCTDEPLYTGEPSIKIIKAELANYPNFLADFFYAKRYQADFLLILEDTENIVFKDSTENIFGSLKDDGAYNVPVAPLVYEVFDYETEPFTGQELRLFSFKMKEFKEVLSKGDFSGQEGYEVTSSLLIQKNEIDSDFEIFKASRFEKEVMTVSEYFNLAVAYFYKDSTTSEFYFLKALEAEADEPSYKTTGLSLLLKLLFRRQEFNRVIELAEQYKNYAAENPLSWFYKGMAHLYSGDSLNGLRSYHKALKLKDNLPFMYNYSDLNWKLYSFVGEVFYREKRYKNAVKYFNIADECLKERKSPLIYLSLAKLKFYLEDYEASFNIFSQLFELETIPVKVVAAAKVTFLNLLLFMDFKDEFIDILSRDYFDKPEEVLRVGDTFYMNENFEAALKLYLLVIKKFGVENKLLFKLGYICSKLRILDQACNHFEKYLEREPDDLDALNNLAFLYLNLEKLDLAEKTYLKILKLNNYSFEANLHLAIIYMNLRNRAKAKQYLDKAKMLNPVSQEVIKLHKIYMQEFK